MMLPTSLRQCLRYIAVFLLACSMPLESAPVEFEFYLHTVTNASVVGDFNDWNPRQHPMQKGLQGRWFTSVDLPYGEYRYAYQVNNEVVVHDLGNHAFETNLEGRIVSMLAVAPAEPQGPSHQVIFRYFNPSTPGVHLAGEFNGWSTSSHPLEEIEPGLWQVQLAISEGYFGYKFIDAGAWVMDPLNEKVKVVQGSANSGIDTALGENVSLETIRGLLKNSLHRVKISVRLPDAVSVCIAGEFNGWSANEDPLTRVGDGRWVKWLTLPEGDYAYKFVADGNWILDPGNTETKAVDGIPNSLLRVLPGTGADSEIDAAGRSSARYPVTFRLFGQLYNQVSLAGSFNEWDEAGLELTRDGDGWWTTTAELPAGQHTYRFKVDGHWHSDPQNPVLKEEGGWLNSVVTVAPASPGADRGHVEENPAVLTGRTVYLEAALPVRSLQQEIYRQHLLGLLEKHGRDVVDGSLTDASSAPGQVRIGWHASAVNGIPLFEARHNDGAALLRLQPEFPMTSGVMALARSARAQALQVCSSTDKPVINTHLEPPDGSLWEQGRKLADQLDLWTVMRGIEFMEAYAQKEGLSHALARDLAVAYADAAQDMARVHGGYASVLAGRALFYMLEGDPQEQDKEFQAYIVFQAGRPAEAAALLADSLPVTHLGKLVQALVFARPDELYKVVGTPDCFGARAVPGVNVYAPSRDMPKALYKRYYRTLCRVLIGDGRAATADFYLDRYAADYPEDLGLHLRYAELGGVNVKHAAHARLEKLLFSPGVWGTFIENKPVEDGWLCKAGMEELLYLLDHVDDLDLLQAKAFPAPARTEFLKDAMTRLAYMKLEFARYSLASKPSAESLSRLVDPLVDYIPLLRGIQEAAADYLDRPVDRKLARMLQDQAWQPKHILHVRHLHEGAGDSCPWSRALYEAFSVDRIPDWMGGLSRARVHETRNVAIRHLIRLWPTWQFGYAYGQNRNVYSDLRFAGEKYCANSYGYCVDIGHYYGRVHPPAGDPEKAVELLERATTIAPYEARPYQALAKIYFNLGLEDNVLELYEKYLPLDDGSLGSAAIRRYAAQVLLHRGDGVKALDIARESGHSWQGDSLDLAGYACEVNGLLDEAETWYQRLEDRYDNSASLAFFYARRLPDIYDVIMEQECSEALAHDDVLTAVNTGVLDWDVVWRSAYWLVMLDRPEESWKLLEACMERRWSYGKALYVILAWVLEKSPEQQRNAAALLSRQSAHDLRDFGQFLVQSSPLSLVRKEAYIHHRDGWISLLSGCLADFRGDHDLAELYWREALLPRNHNIASSVGLAWWQFLKAGKDPRQFTDIPAP